LKRAFSRFIGVDLGGGRGKTTAIAEIRSGGSGAQVVEVATRSGRSPWTDDTLLGRLMAASPADAVIAVDAPLTQAACGRCERPVCPGMEACADPAVVWLRTEGRALVRKVDLPPLGNASPMRGLPDEDDGYVSYTSFTEPHAVYKVSIRRGSVADLMRSPLAVILLADDAPVADQDRAALSGNPVRYPPAAQAQEVDRSGVETVDRPGFGVGEPQPAVYHLVRQIQDEQRAHPVIAEALPHFCEEQRGKPAGMSKEAGIAGDVRESGHGVPVTSV